MGTRAQVIAWLAAPVEHTILQVPRALIASGLAAALDMGTLVTLVEWAGWNPLPAAVIGYLLGGVLQYVLCAVWVFPAAPQRVSVGFAAFTLLSLVGLGGTWATMALLYDVVGVNYALAKVAALGLTFFWNFCSRKFWLFRSAADRWAAAGGGTRPPPQRCMNPVQGTARSGDRSRSWITDE